MVEKIEIIFSPHVISYLDDLVFILYKKEYFGFIETAEVYVIKIYDTISKNIRTSTYKKTPKSLQYLGSSYIFFSSNQRTTWYIFFERKEQLFLITGIINNHCNEAKEL